jgi:hypothetical protein
MKLITNSLIAIVVATMFTIALSAQQSSTENQQQNPATLGRCDGNLAVAWLGILAAT